MSKINVSSYNSSVESHSSYNESNASDDESLDKGEMHGLQLNEMFERKLKRNNEVRKYLLIEADKEMTYKTKRYNRMMINGELPRIVDCSNYQINYSESFTKPTNYSHSNIRRRTGDLKKKSFDHFKENYQANGSKLYDSIVDNFIPPKKQLLTKERKTRFKTNKLLLNPIASSTYKPVTQKETPTSRKPSKDSLTENIENQNVPGSYINNKRTYNRVLEGFLYLRTLPFMLSNSLTSESLTNKRRFQSEIESKTMQNVTDLAEDFEFHKECLIIKDNIGDKDVKKSRIIKRRNTDKLSIKSYLNLKSKKEIPKTISSQKLLADLSSPKRGIEQAAITPVKKMSLFSIKSISCCTFKEKSVNQTCESVKIEHKKAIGNIKNRFLLQEDTPERNDMISEYIYKKKSSYFASYEDDSNFNINEDSSKQANIVEEHHINDTDRNDKNAEDYNLLFDTGGEEEEYNTTDREKHESESNLSNHFSEFYSKFLSFEKE